MTSTHEWAKCSEAVSTRCSNSCHRVTQLVMSIAAFALGMISQSTEAGVVLQWGGPNEPIVSANQPFSGSSTVLDLSNPLNPPVGPDYYANNTGRNPVFFGAQRVDATSGMTLENQSQFVSNGTQDSLVSTVRALGVGTASNHSLYYWKREGDNGQFGFLEPNLPSVMGTIIGLNNTDPSFSPSTQVRFVLASGGNFFISEDRFAGAFQLSGLTVTNAQWFSYNPLVDITAIGPATSLPTSNLEGMGLLVSHSRTFQTTALGGRVLQPVISAFQVLGDIPDPAQIPEPVSSILFGIGLSGLVLMKRRKVDFRHESE